MTKNELIEAIAARANIKKPQAEIVVNAVFDAIADSLREGSGVEIRGFGSFHVRQHKAYRGRNPRTNDIVDVPSKRRPFFKVGKELRELVDASRNLDIDVTDKG